MPTRRREPTEPQRPSLGRPLRILHVEDDPGYSELVKHWLKRDMEHPYELTQCTDSRQAVALIRQGRRFDVAVSDAHLEQPPLSREEKQSDIPHEPVEMLIHLQENQNTHPILFTGLVPEGKPLVQNVGLKVILKDEPARGELIRELNRAIQARSRHEEEHPIDRDALAAIGPLLHIRGGRRQMLELLSRQPVSNKAIRDMYAGKRVVYTLKQRIDQLRHLQREGNLSQREASRVETWIRQLQTMDLTANAAAMRRRRF